jgi:hypothetical protein
MGLVSRQSMHVSKDKIKQMMVSNPSLLHGNSTYHLATLRKAPAMAGVLWEVKKALDQGSLPEKVEGASTDVFKLYNCTNEVIAIFKACTYGNVEGLSREVAAYCLDHQGFAGVPPTVITTLQHAQFGGLRRGVCQLHIPDAVHPHHAHLHLSGERFSASSLRKIASLDIRLLNADRHTSNLLYTEKGLIPIDHTLILPNSTGGVHIYFGWLAWPEAKSPFSESEKEYLLALDAEKDRTMLIEECKLPSTSADLHYCATRLLQLGVQVGLSAFEIGSTMVKKVDETDAKKIRQPSTFEQALFQKTTNAKDHWKRYKKEVEQLMQGVVEYALSQR